MDNTTNNKWGFLRETKKDAEEAGIDKATGLHRTGLEDYLAVIFPEIKAEEWVHDKKVPNLNGQTRPDYRCENLKLIVEFDGLPHYTNPMNIKKDKEKEGLYSEAGYKVVRIPYFIQLSNDVIQTLFDREIKEPMFDASIPSLAISGNNTPAFLCPAGIKRMAEEFHRFPQQYEVNLKALQNETDQELAGTSLLQAEYQKIFG